MPIGIYDLRCRGYGADDGGDGVDDVVRVISQSPAARRLPESRRSNSRASHLSLLSSLASLSLAFALPLSLSLSYHVRSLSPSLLACKWA